jgi:hypothetical protein
VCVRLLYLLMVRAFGWLVLLGRARPEKTAARIEARPRATLNGKPAPLPPASETLDVVERESVAILRAAADATARSAKLSGADAERSSWTKSSHSERIVVISVKVTASRPVASRACRPPANFFDETLLCELAREAVGPERKLKRA